jgi:hypothetical protein
MTYMDNGRFWERKKTQNYQLDKWRMNREWNISSVPQLSYVWSDILLIKNDSFFFRHSPYSPLHILNILMPFLCPTLSHFFILLTHKK